MDLLKVYHVISWAAWPLIISCYFADMFRNSRKDQIDILEFYLFQWSIEAFATEQVTRMRRPITLQKSPHVAGWVQMHLPHTKIGHYMHANRRVLNENEIYNTASPVFIHNSPRKM